MMPTRSLEFSNASERTRDGTRRVHWADEGSLRLLEYVARELAGARLLLIGTYRDVELSRRHPLSQTLAELTRERLFERIILRGLSREDNLFPPAPPATAATGLCKATGRCP